MFAYCTERLHLSDAEAYLRIAAARASREHPVLLEMLADGRLHLTAIAKLAPHLTPENRDELLERATHRTKREIEELVAEIAPRPDAATVVRRLPERRAANLAGSSSDARFERRHPAGPAHVTRCEPSGLDRLRVLARSPECPSGNCVQTQWRRTGRPWSSPSPRAATGSSSPPPPSCATSSSGSAVSCAPRFPTETSARSSSTPPPRRSSGSNRAGSPGRGPPGSPFPPDDFLRDDALYELGRATPAAAETLHGDAPHPGRDQASRVRARRRAMPLRGRTGPAMHRARRAASTPPASVRLRRAPLRGRDLPAVPGPQPLPGRDRLRRGHGPTPALEDGVGGLASAPESAGAAKAGHVDASR